MAKKSVVTQRLAEHKLYEALFDAADDVLYCPHSGQPDVTGYPEGYYNAEAIPTLHAAFLALVAVPVLQVRDGIKVVGMSQELITKVMETVQFYYRITKKGRVSRVEIQEMLSRMISALQTVLIAVAAHDADVKDQIRSLLVEIKGGSVNGDSGRDSD